MNLTAWQADNMTSSLLRTTTLALAIALGLSACGKKETPPPAAASPENAATQSTAAPNDPMSVRVDAELAKRVKLGTISTTSVAETIRVAGQFNVNQYKTSRVGAPITGRITDINVEFGQSVSQGQVLAEINSQELAQAQLNFLRAHSQQQLLTRAVERAQLLLSADVIGSAELQRRQNELTVALAEKRAAFDQLRTLGLSTKRIEALETTGQIQPTTTLTSTLAGVVIDRKVAIGQVVSPADQLFVVSDLRTLWAQAQVPEQDAQFIKRGQRVQIEVPALDNKVILGKVEYIADVVSPETRTVLVGVEVQNPERTLKPSMLMTMLVEGRVAPRQVVPIGALVREEDKDFVFVETGEGVYRMTQVQTGIEREGQRVLARPLPDEARIVLDGAFHLNNVRAQRALSK
jgi:membrane fusion protein, heavy metal efflux system